MSILLVGKAFLLLLVLQIAVGQGDVFACVLGCLSMRAISKALVQLLLH
jgi:hypothetical protein